MTESFYIISILWSLDISIQIVRSPETRFRQWLLLGLSWGIAVLLRQLFLLFIPFALLWLWWVSRPKSRYLWVPLTVIFFMILPWMVRNYLAFDQFVLLNTNAGFAFFWGNHPIYGTKFVPILTPQMGSYRALIPPELLNLNEAALDTALLKIALQNIFEDPGRYLLLSLSRIPPYFMFWPSAESGIASNLARIASFGLFLPFMLYGLIQTFRSKFTSISVMLISPFFVFYLFIVIYTGVHILTWTLIRYRLPVDAILMIFAGWAIVDLFERFKIRKQESTIVPT